MDHLEGLSCGCLANMSLELPAHMAIAKTVWPAAQRTIWPGHLHEVLTAFSVRAAARRLTAI